MIIIIIMKQVNPKISMIKLCYLINNKNRINSLVSKDEDFHI